MSGPSVGASARSNPVRLTVRVYPSSKGTHVGGRYGDSVPPVLIVRVMSPAVDGRANGAVVDALASALGVRPSAVEIVAGTTSRTKVVEVKGAHHAAIDRLLTA